MVIVLTKDEKRTFFSFLSLFLGISLIFIVIIAWLFYQMQYKLNYDLITSKMQINASKLSSNIIKAHMQQLPLKKSDLSVDKGFDFGLYDKDKKPLITDITHKIDFSKKRYIAKSGNLGLIDDGVSGHLGIYYIVIEENSFRDLVNSLLKKSITIFSLVYLVLALIGYFLAKIFIKPIQNQREKLNSFVRDSTHELNTPITALLMSVNSKNMSAKNLERIEISAKRVSEIYKDLTYLFLKDKESTEVKELDLKSVLTLQVEYLKEFALKKRITIDLKAKNSTFKIDEESFIRLVNNLIFNAIKYTQTGGKIDITLTEKELIIKDNGIGIDKLKLEKIFNKFYRATTTQGGFGIGLSIVDRICKTYNIQIDVVSEIKKGTTFRLEFK